MFTKNLTKAILALSSSALLSFALTACGGGSSSTSTTTIEETDKVTITDTNSQDVIATVANVIDSSYYYELPIAGFAVSSVESKATLPSLNILQLPVFEKIINPKQTSTLTAATTSYTYYCTDSGSVIYTAQNDYNIVMDFNNCVESGITMDGTVTATTNSSYTSFSFAFTNFLITDGSANRIYYQSLTYMFTQDPNTYEITSMSISITGSLNVNGDTAEFDHYTMSARIGTDNSVFFTVNGYVMDPCLNAWIGMETLQEIKLGYYDTCPTQGQIRIDGNGSDITVTYNNDGSVDVSGAIEAHYNSCTDISGGCAL